MPDNKPIEETPVVENEAPAAPSTDDEYADFLMAPEPPADTSDDIEQVGSDDSAAAPSEDEGEPETPPESEAEEEEESEEEADEEPDEDSDEDSESEEEETEEEESEEEDPASVILFHDSEGEPVTLEEAQRGHMRQADYTKKTQELAEAREQVVQMAQGVQAHEQKVAENLSLALNVLSPEIAELSETNWDELAQADPYTFAEKKARLEQAQLRYSELQRRGQEMVEQKQQQAKAQYDAKRTAEAEALRMALPALADPKTGRDLQHKIKSYAMETAGLTENEATNMIDHRLIVVLDKARQFDELKAGSLEIGKKKVKTGPKKRIAGGKPQSKAKQSARKQKSARQRVASEGTTDAMVDYLMGG